MVVPSASGAFNPTNKVQKSKKFQPETHSTIHKADCKTISFILDSESSTPLKIPLLHS